MRNNESTDAIAWMAERVIWMLIGALLLLLLSQFPEQTGYTIERATDMPAI